MGLKHGYLPCKKTGLAGSPSLIICERKKLDACSSFLQLVRRVDSYCSLFEAHCWRSSDEYTGKYLLEWLLWFNYKKTFFTRYSRHDKHLKLGSWCCSPWPDNPYWYNFQGHCSQVFSDSYRRQHYFHSHCYARMLHKYLLLHIYYQHVTIGSHWQNVNRLLLWQLWSTYVRTLVITSWKK